MTTNSIVAGLLIAACIATMALLLVAVRRRRLPGSNGLVGATIAVAVWTLMNATQVLSEDREVKILTHHVAFTAIVVLALSMWWAMTALAGTPRMRRHDWLIVAAPGVAILVLVWTGYRGLMFQELLVPQGRGPVDNTPGPWYLVTVLWAYALIGGGMALFVRTALKAPPRYRHQAWLMIAVVVLPIVLNALAVSRVVGFGGHDPTPIAMSFTSAGLWWGVRQLGLIDAQLGVLPVARDVVVDAMRDGVVVIDGRGRILDLNGAAAALLGAEADALAGRPADEVITGWHAHAGDSTWEFTHTTADRDHVLETTVTPITPGQPLSPRVAMLRDVTDRRQAEEALAESARINHHQSRHDPLTGLANRTLLFEIIRAALAEPDAATTALLILDLDGFKDLNDTFGHRAGDDALREMAARLVQSAGADAHVARLAGDEFAVLIPRSDADAAATAAFRIQQALGVPFPVEGTDVRLAGSVGVAIAPEHGEDPDDLVHAADVAMYHAKRHSTGVAVYAPSVDVRRPDRLLLRQQLRHAIDQGELEVHYQPQCRTDGTLFGAEALVRWRHPERGLLMPVDFLPLAEESDLICALTDAVLAIALRDSRTWGAAEGVRVAVNISARDLQDPRLPHRVSRALIVSGADPRSLTLEVTENALATSRDAGDHLAVLRTRGVMVSLDDFGTGFAPLATLREIPVDELKIDRTFVAGMASVQRDAALVAGLVRLGHDLGLMVVAEGVETRATADHLHSLDCDVLQGYLIGSPQPGMQVEAVALAAAALAQSTPPPAPRGPRA